MWGWSGHSEPGRQELWNQGFHSVSAAAELPWSTRVCEHVRSATVAQSQTSQIGFLICQMG